MKPKEVRTHFLILLVFFLCNINIIPQEQIPDEFLLGGNCANMHDPYQSIIHFVNFYQIHECGLNAVLQKAKWTGYPDPELSNLDSLSTFKYVYMCNDSSPDWVNNPNNTDWISYFTHAKYYRWEAEGDEYFPYPGENRSIVGVKHNNAGYATNDGWSSGAGNTGAYFIDGPDYTQYKRYVYTNRNLESPTIQYNAVFSIKLAEIPQNPGTDPIAKILVTVYDEGSQSESFALDSMFLTADDLTTDYQPFTLSYNYSDYMIETADTNETSQLPSAMNWLPLGGQREPAPWFDLSKKVRFKVQKLADYEIIVDYVEVYDAGDVGIWKRYFSTLENYSEMVNLISTYNQNYDSLTSKVFYETIDEPHSWDSFIPIKIIQHILDSLETNRNLLVHFCSEWDGWKEGVRVLDKWVDIAQPRKLMFWYTPFSMDDDGVPYSQDFTLYKLHERLQDAYLKQPGFFVTLQSWGNYKTNLGRYDTYYMPNSNEINAETMLALAHGVHGIFYEDYYSHLFNNKRDTVRALVAIPEHDFFRYPEWYQVQRIANRMKGYFGQTYLTLDYTGETLMLRRSILPSEINTAEMVSNNYLTLSTNTGGSIPQTFNFHTGFFTKQTDNNYFLLINLTANSTRTINITVESPGTNYLNYRFRNIETEYNFDTTFSSLFSLNYTFLGGEGYLFQVAPVVKYGGKLYYSETISNNTTLYEDMTIENGITLTINSNYTCYGNIYLKPNARIQTSGNGNINLANGKSIIVQGVATLAGTQDNPLTITTQTDSNAVVVYSLSGNLTANYCHFIGGRNGIKVSGNANNLTVSQCAFDNFTNDGILFLGNATNLPKIKWCSFSNSSKGIQGMGLSSIIVQFNSFTDNLYDIYLSQVSDVQIVSNTLENSSLDGQGIFLSSSGGYIRRNEITGHINGIYLANSSPNIGANTIYGNKNNGIYAGTGSQPDLRGYLIHCNGSHLYYPLRGYNDIYENGIYDSHGHNEGSEIYLSYSNLLMNVPCNNVMDDRESVTATEPLIKPLVSGSLSFQQGSSTLDLSYQGWGNNLQFSLRDRFGRLRVDIDPNYLGCPEIEYIDCPYFVLAQDRSVIDTLYPAGNESEGLDPLDEQLRIADEYYNNGNYSSAEPIYQNIVNDYPNEQKAVKAYNQLYSIKKVTDSTGTNFTELKTLLDLKQSEITDSLIIKIVSQLSTLCLVGNSEYIPAISTFDQIVQQNPETEEGLYAEIDALTTAIISYYRNGGGLQKGLPGKYKADSEEELISKLNNLMKNNFEEGGSKKNVIPEVYNLYNNYPNPFNPATTIRFDITERTNVELAVYNVLGQKVKSLITGETRNPGRYEVNFNGNSLASGVYIYRLTTTNYSQSKKMLLIK